MSSKDCLEFKFDQTMQSDFSCRLNFSSRSKLDSECLGSRRN